MKYACQKCFELTYVCPMCGVCRICHTKEQFEKEKEIMNNEK